MKPERPFNLCILALVAVLCAATTAPAEPSQAKRSPTKRSLSIDVATRTGVSIQKGLAFLVSQQRSDGAWAAFGQPHPAITALAIKALAQDRSYGSGHPVVKRGLAYVLKFVQDDGGIYVPGEGMRNYHTSVALMALSSMKKSDHASLIAGSQRFLTKLQWDAGEGHEADSSWYGGAGYGRHKRPDLSNTQYMLEALHQSGLPSDDPAYKKAMKFIERCQMMGETNDQAFAKGSHDGGFVYTAANGGESKAGAETIDGDTRLRSYGSMTYAGFKSMLYAKVDRDDPRVLAALKWIREHYTLDYNPNMPGKAAKEGLYYYYHVFARALLAWGEETIEDGTGIPHRWRSELCEKLMTLQRADGSWFNEADRWYEGNPHLVTAYAVLSMQSALLE